MNLPPEAIKMIVSYIEDTIYKSLYPEEIEAHKAGLGVIKITHYEYWETITTNMISDSGGVSFLNLPSLRIPLRISVTEEQKDIIRDFDFVTFKIVFILMEREFKSDEPETAIQVLDNFLQLLDDFNARFVGFKKSDWQDKLLKQFKTTAKRKRKYYLKLREANVKKGNH